MNSKGIKITYWLSTGFVAFVGFSGILNVLQIESLVKVNRELGLPQYLMPFLGVIKILGAITIVLPLLKRFHEAAYAGLIFYFTGATYVLIANGKGIEKYGVTLIIIIATVVSYLTSLKRKQTI
ncbi:DoxX-like family protein [Chitinophaga sp. YR573]|uniref:DoxX family protein n=1 Tax=Chitinophaga sp. YR573 TaxID=1881040 RepID=UPI0008CA85EC|nr:DoxX family protein [Chitinophaga sp. YR573]SEW45638.1 DoxX-like family protein [Chitinophaga sp. YR573]